MESTMDNDLAFQHGRLPMPAEIAQAVAKVMRAVGVIEKRGENQHHHYRYAMIGDLMAALQPALAEAGLVVVQTPVAERVIADSLLLVDYEFTLHHVSGKSWSGFRHTGAVNFKNRGGYDDKAYNKALVSARKYALISLFMVPTMEMNEALSDGDADAQPNYPEPFKPRPKPVRADVQDKPADAVASGGEESRSTEAMQEKLKALRDVIRAAVQEVPHGGRVVDVPAAREAWVTKVMPVLREYGRPATTEWFVAHYTRQIGEPPPDMGGNGEAGRSAA